MATLDDLKQSLSDLNTQVMSLESDVQSRIDAAVAAQKASDQAGFDEAVAAVRGMVSQLATQASAMHQTATSIDTSTASTATALPPGAGTPEVQTTQTATTDPTGTAATAGTLVNVPDGAMSTAAPGASADPATGAQVDQAGSAAAPFGTAGTPVADPAAPNPPADVESVSAEGDEARAANPSATTTVKTEPNA